MAQLVRRYMFRHFGAMLMGEFRIFIHKTSHIVIGHLVHFSMLPGIEEPVITMFFQTAMKYFLIAMDMINGFFHQRNISDLGALSIKLNDRG